MRVIEGAWSQSLSEFASAWTTEAEKVKVVSAERDELKRQLDDAERRIKVMQDIVGNSHIERDVQTMDETVDAFPNGLLITEEFGEVHSAFGYFADCALHVLSSEHPKPRSKFATDVMSPIYQATHRMVTDRLTAKRNQLLLEFGVNLEDIVPVSDNELPGAQSRPNKGIFGHCWYAAMQQQMLRELRAPCGGNEDTMLPVSDESILANLADEDPFITSFHAQMLEASAAEDVEYGTPGQPLTVVTIARWMLRFHTLALLSDPRCFFELAPGKGVQFFRGQYLEIMSPGRACKAGTLKDGDGVTVVLPGLYFWQPDKQMKCLVTMPLVCRYDM
jgi:hypothetical protein